MNATTLLLQGWSWNLNVIAAGVAATVVYGLAFRSRARWGRFAAAVGVLLLTLLSPLNALAGGVLFSAHMTQHILLLLVVPALLLFSLPRDFGWRWPVRTQRLLPIVGWAGGVGSMWFWHVPELCNAAATSGTVHATQTLSLLLLGTAFWWPVFAPRAADRLPPGPGIAYLFTACLACTGLGILLTLTPIQACPVFRVPLTADSAWRAVRSVVSAERDQQIGGLLMWVPMCLIYVAAIVVEVYRWLGGHDDVAGIRREVRT